MKIGYSRSGFTLIELMIVVIIIAALAGMVLPKILPAGDMAKRKIAMGDISGISTALKLYRLNNNRYPTTEEGLNILLQPSSSRDWKDAFLEKPAIDPWGNKYEYRCPGTHGTIEFDLWSNGPDTKTSDDDISNWSQE